MKSGHRRGFTLLEALVALVLATVGVASVVKAIGALTQAQAKMQAVERLQDLAAYKYQELIATGDYATITEGDFQDQGLPDYRWTCDVETTSYEGVVVVRVTAQAPGIDSDKRSVSAVFFEPTNLTTGATTP